MGRSDPDLLRIEGGDRPPDVEKVYDFYVTTPGGLEDVVLRDMKLRLKALERVRVERGRRHGRIFFHYRRSPRNLLELRSVENVFALLGEVHGVTAGQPGLLQIAARVGKTDLVPAVALHAALSGEQPEFSFRLTCTAGRGHRFSASELHQVVQTVLGARYGLDPGGPEAPYHLHLHVMGRRALFGLQLTGRRMRDRDYRLASVPGGLAGPVAYCMGLLAGVERRDVCLDPMCGGGTTLLEAGLAFGPRALVGGDVSEAALAAARENAAQAGQKLRLARWDAGRLPLPDASVDKLLCNLPYGKKTVLLGAGRTSLMREFGRVVRPGRIAVLLSEDTVAVQKALEERGAPFRLLQQVRIYVRGREPSLYVLRRKNADAIDP